MRGTYPALEFVDDSTSCSHVLFHVLNVDRVRRNVLGLRVRNVAIQTQEVAVVHAEEELENTRAVHVAFDVFVPRRLCVEAVHLANLDANQIQHYTANAYSDVLLRKLSRKYNLNHEITYRLKIKLNDV